jgi:hypothetical protein
MGNLKKYIFGRVKGDVLNTNLVASYSFNNNLNDNTGLTSGLSSPAVIFQNGKLNNAIDTTGSGYVNVPDSNNLSFTNGTNDLPFTISLWVYFSSFSFTGNWLFNKRNALSGGDEWQLVYFQNKIQFFKFDKASNSIIQIITSSANIVSLNNWHNIVFTDNGSKTYSGMKLYYNNTLLNTTNESVGNYTGMINGISQARIGSAAWDASSNLNHRGLIDELNVWKNRELNASEISFLYNSGNGKPYPFT